MRMTNHSLSDLKRRPSGICQSCKKQQQPSMHQMVLPLWHASKGSQPCANDPRADKGQTRLHVENYTKQHYMHADVYHNNKVHNSSIMLGDRMLAQHHTMITALRATL
jgi:hypothetical protein